jgi:hypothetical protein
MRPAFERRNRASVVIPDRVPILGASAAKAAKNASATVWIIVVERLIEPYHLQLSRDQILCARPTAVPHLRDRARRAAIYSLILLKLPNSQLNRVVQSREGART